MVAYSVDKSKWTALLPPLLTPEVRQVHADLSPEDKRDYDCLKSQILKRFTYQEIRTTENLTV